MGVLNASEIKRIEKRFPTGISSGAIVEIFRDKGLRFSEATLRKYVQLELLPKSTRVGTRGRHRGSSGLYPTSIVRQIGAIKDALEEGATLEEIRLGCVGLGGEVERLRRAVDEVAGRFTEAIGKGQDRSQRASLRKALIMHRRQLERHVKELDKLATKIGRGVGR